MTKAIFLDRDGVINLPAFNPVTRSMESPHCSEDVSLYKGVVETLLEFQDRGYLLFVVSNQPSFAKKKTTMKNLFSVHNKIHSLLEQGGVKITDYFYCYHHPDFTGECQCRKPKPFFVSEAIKLYGINPEESWMIGDRETDIQCGQAAGVRTMLISTSTTQHPVVFRSLRDSVDFIQ